MSLKITTEQLRQIIKEEIEAVLSEDQQVNEEQIDEGLKEIAMAALMGLFGSTAMAGPLKTGPGGEFATTLADADTVEVMSDYLDVKTADPKGGSKFRGAADMASRVDSAAGGLNLDDLSDENPQDAYLLRQLAQGFQAQKEKIGIEAIKKQIDAYQNKISEPKKEPSEPAAMDYKTGNPELYKQMKKLGSTRRF